MFEIRQRGSTLGREVLGGLTTFMAMSYILFVQPAVLSKVPGLDGGGVFMATCIASGVACILMGVLANYPIALAPGMGENFFFVFALCGVGAAAGTFSLAWPEAFALTVVTGMIFLLLSLVGFRSRLLNAIPDALKSGIAAGIGLFIALIGFEWGHLIEAHPATLVTQIRLTDEHLYVAGLTLFGLALTLLLAAYRVRGAVLIGILATTAATCAVGEVFGVPGVNWAGALGVPTGLTKTAGAFLGGYETIWDKLLSPHALHLVNFAFILLFMDLFDTVGTLVGVSKRAGLMREGRLPRAERALAADAAGTVIGAALGTSTVTSYIESITGVASGARTGLAAVVAGVCMLAALLFQPLVEMVGGGVVIGQQPWGDPIIRYPMIAPALIVVGAMMMRAMRDVSWDDLTEALPAFLTMVAMPFTYSISTGIAIGFVSYAFGKLVTGRVRQCPLIVYVFAVLFALQYAASILLGG